MHSALTPFGRRLLALVFALTLCSGMLGTAPRATAAPLSASAAQVTHGGNFRREPQITPQTVIGQVCPGDRMTITQTSTRGTTTWYYGTISTVVADCDPAHVDAGTAGWLSATLVRVEAAAGAPAAPTAPPATTSVVITREPGIVSRGATASVSVHTAPNLACDITVQYKSGPSTAAGLVAKTSTSSGDVSWSWKVGTRTTPGDWPVTITCGRASATTYVQVH